MAIYRLGEFTPDIHPTAWVAESADIIGNVKIEAGASVWFGVVVRGDNDQIIIGENTNIQDGSMLHADPGHPLIIGKNVTVGHHAILHACTVGDGALIGIRSTVLTGAVIGEGCLVGACALVTEGKKIEKNALIIGSPATVSRIMSDEAISKFQRTAGNYVRRGKLYAEKLERIDQV